MSALRQESPENRKLNTILWIVGLAFSVFLGTGVYQLISFGEVKAQTVTNTATIGKIQRDYLPYFAFENIIESNNKLINILTAIDSKDDDRYQKAIKEWSDLQMEVAKQAGQNKRSGGGGIAGGE